ncbi:MAG: hypothetical protein ACHQCG_05955 [Solirubrobacterales bacterium]
MSGVAVVRYGLGGVMIVGGVVIIILNPGGLGVDGFAMAVGGGLAVLMINFLFRLGASGDLERQREEDARTYFDEQRRVARRRGEEGAQMDAPCGRRHLRAGAAPASRAGFVRVSDERRGGPLSKSYD